MNPRTSANWKVSAACKWSCANWKLEVANWKASAACKWRCVNWKLEVPTESLKLLTGIWKLPTGSWKLPTGSWKLPTERYLLHANEDVSTGSWKLSTGIHLLHANEVQYQFIPWVAAQATHIPKDVSLAICSGHLHCNTWSSGGTALCKSGGNGQSIGSTVSDALVHSWLRLTATKSTTLGYFSSITASSL